MILTTLTQLVRRSRSCRVCCSARRGFSSTVPTAPYDILFCGTDSFASTSLSALLSHRSTLCSSLHVLTPPDVAQKWGASRMKVSPVKQVALSQGLAHQDVPSGGMVDYTPPSHLHDNPQAILLTCSFGHLIPDELLDAFPNPWQRINIHPSLLPQLRGAAPIQWALARRLTRSGVTIQTLEKGKFDTGRIVSQESFAFPPTPVEQGGFLEVEPEMATRAADLLIRTLHDLPNHWANSWVQPEDERTYAPKLKLQNSVIRWDAWSAADVVARERGFAYLYPLSTTLHPPDSPTHPNLNFHPVAVHLSNTSAIPMEELRSADRNLAAVLLAPSTPVGSAIYCAPLDAVLVKTHAEVLAVRSLKVANKRPKDAHDWWRGYRDRVDPRTGLLCFR
ncbi:Formyl transferase, N-terminal [Kalmanozyma brasiliensis GHG001]|uniref:Formyl transferase, N-terminal n=1 Tax=Kalmanozyma brasiliensis (strain GHG001) TaxID=1365824 RepID=UPI00286828F4|nr:Formyl transferase, N-terminal [Kalmanozyma brasiliensis GHG001]KAF6766998.1 Formyl transferase, N-terminal [Kalmanozyma brasiliensis GHG001]